MRSKPEEKPKRSRKRKEDGSSVGPTRTSDDSFLQAGPSSSHQLAVAMHMSLATQGGHSHSGIPVPRRKRGNLYSYSRPASCGRVVEFVQTAQSYMLSTKVFWILYSSIGLLWRKCRSISITVGLCTGQEHALKKCVGPCRPSIR